jgi:DNA polymerase-1
MPVMTRPMLYLLDGHALAYRHFFGQIARPLMTATGQPTGAVFGFARTLMDILERDRPYYLAVAFDDGLTGRDTVYPAYKGTRDKMPDDLNSQMGYIFRLVDAFSVPRLMLAGTEADDVIGTVALQAEALGVDVRIVTGDRDLLQLLSPHTTVRLAIPKAGTPDELYDEAAFRAKWGLEPRQLVDLKALEGDTSDNIPGVEGIGGKTATALLQAHETLEGIYAAIPTLKGAVVKRLEAGRERAFISQQLARIRRDMPITLDLKECIAHDFDKGAVEALFRELEFGSLFNALNRITGAKAGSRVSADQLPMFAGDAEPTADLIGEGPLPPPVYPTVIVDTAEKLADLAARLAGASAIAFDTETTGLNEMQDTMVGMSFAVDGETGYYVPVGHRVGVQLPLETVMDALRPALTDPAIPKIAHHAKFDLIIMRRHGIDIGPIAHDTQIAQFLVDSTETLGLKRLSKQYLGVEMTPIRDLIGKGKNAVTMDQIAIERAAPYAAADAVSTFRLRDAIVPQLGQWPDMALDRGSAPARETGGPAPERDPLWGTENPPTPRDVYEKLEIPLVPVLADMECTGVLLDVPYLGALAVRLGERLAALEETIYGLSGGYGRFNINSPKQLNDVLFGKLGLSAEGVAKTTHGFSTAAHVLEAMSGQHPIIDRILEYREISKLKGTYVDALPALINPQTGRVHTSYNQNGASTGRLSSSDPNLQNVPNRTDLGREVRRAFIAPPGWQILSVDYSQVELRIMAHITQEPTLVEAFRNGQDIHATTAAVVYNVPLDAVTHEQRSNAKRVNFGLLYGMGAFRLARETDMTFAESQAFVNTYYTRLPGIRAYLDRAKHLARELGYLTTLYGRRRRFPGLRAANKTVQGQAEREAINMPIQGTAADIMKAAMIDLARALAARRSPARLLLQVHDELVLEVPDEALAETTALVVSVMERAAALSTPLRADAEAGPNWLDVAKVRV